MLSVGAMVADQFIASATRDDGFSGLMRLRSFACATSKNVTREAATAQLESVRLQIWR